MIRNNRIVKDYDKNIMLRACQRQAFEYLHQKLSHDRCYMITCLGTTFETFTEIESLQEPTTLYGRLHFYLLFYIIILIGRTYFISLLTCSKAFCRQVPHEWPVGHNGSSFRSSSCRNHTGATDFQEQITNYLIKEASYQAVVGPFKDNPSLSPLNSVPKNDSSERRVIVDLSFPEGESVNFGILKDEYLGNKISVSYPKVDDLIHLIKLKGQGCMIFKEDLKRAYRQLVVDPGDNPTLRLQVEGSRLFR